MVDNKKLEALKETLRNIFQFENNDLDFGIYRIINLKKKEIAEFIDEELGKLIIDEVKTLEEDEEILEDLKNLKEEIEKDLGCDVLEAKKKYSKIPKVKDYLYKEREFEKSKRESFAEAEVYDFLVDFFSRYYDKGDFISKRRYSRENKYAIPYNGEEVYLYWANQDQYYIKTTENFKNYRFKIKNLRINFEIKKEDVEVEQNNNKSKEEKYFVVDNVEYNSKDKLLNVQFKYGSLDNSEYKEILEKANKIYKEKEGKEKKKLDKDLVNFYNVNKIKESSFGASELDLIHKKINGEDTSKTELEWNMHKYTTKNTSDYFIHKNLKKFLERELDFYIKNEIIHIDYIDKKDDLDISLKKVKVFKKIGKQIIDFLAQIEDFQKRLWEKKKFVLQTNYCMTLDNIDKKYYKEILKNKEQNAEWIELGFIDKNTKLTEKYLEENSTLVLDTKFYDEDFKFNLLSEINDLDEKTNGVLINSENWQALNLLMNKYKEKIKCCYIDPPYNTGGDGFLYKDGYSHSSWMTLLKDRLILGRKLLKKEGVLFSSINDYEVENLTKIGKDLFGYENFIAKLIWENKEGGGSSDSKFFRIKHEYVNCYSKNKDYCDINGEIQKEDSSYNYSDEFVKERGKHKLIKLNSFSIQYSESLDYDIKLPNGKIIRPHENGKRGCWRWGKDQFKWGLDNKFIVFQENANGDMWVYTKQYFKVDHRGKEIIRSVPYRGVISKFSSTQATKQLEKLFGDKSFAYSKPVDYLEFLLSLGISNQDKDLCLDFFAGSGTTGHAVINLNKKESRNIKFILVEMGEHFETVLKKRIEKVIYSENWKNKKPLDNHGSKKQIIKYQTLEQYEDTLNNIEFTEVSEDIKNTKDYKIKYMLDFESRENNVFLNLDSINNPFEYKLKVEKDNEIHEEKIDLIETFNYIAGITVKKIWRKKNDKTGYVFVRGINNENKEVLVIWRNIDKDFDSKKEKKFIEEEFDEDFDLIYVHGNSLIPNTKSIESVFKTEFF